MDCFSYLATCTISITMPVRLNEGGFVVRSSSNPSKSCIQIVQQNRLTFKLAEMTKEKRKPLNYFGNHTDYPKQIKQRFLILVFLLVQDSWEEALQSQMIRHLIYTCTYIHVRYIISVALLCIVYNFRYVQNNNS